MKKLAVALVSMASLLAGPAVLAAPGTEAGLTPGSVGAQILDHPKDDHDHDGDGKPDHDPEDHPEDDESKPKGDH